MPTNSYDEVPYPSHPLAQTHPDHLGTIAALLDIQPPPADHCRVLELGCAAGGNLIPMALTLPQSTFVGIDLSGEQVRQGKGIVEALGLKNIQLQHQSILEVDDGFGQFDYIICHGVFSWVPGPVQDKILEISTRNLAPEGIAYISYNTYPGWHMRGMIRDMMYYHVSRYRDQPPDQQVARARALLDFLARSVPEETEPYSLLLREQLNQLRKHSDAYLFHEHLEECNDPIYFLQFCERLAARGLRYLGEAEFPVMVAGTSFPPDVQRELHELAPNLIEKEQYMDFLRNRTFRQTLVCHEHVQPHYEVRAERIGNFFVASPAKPGSGTPEIESEAEVEFQGLQGKKLTTSIPLVKAAFVCLGESWPLAIPFRQLLQQARGRLQARSSEDSEITRKDGPTLTKALLTAYAIAGNDLVEFSLRPSAFASQVSDRPVASPLARFQAGTNPIVTNLRHKVVGLTEFDRQLLPLLDGTRNHSELMQGMAEKVQQGRLHLSQDNQPVTEPGKVRDLLSPVLEQQLSKLAKTALLMK